MKWILSLFSGLWGWIHPQPDPTVIPEALVQEQYRVSAVAWKRRCLLVAVLLVVSLVLNFNRFNPFGFLSVFKKVDIAPGTSVTEGPGGLVAQPTDGSNAVARWHNPSAKLNLKPIAGPDGKPSLEAGVQVLGIRLVPRVTGLWNFSDARPNAVVGAQVFWFDAYALGPALNDREIGVVLDRRFKVAEIENVGLAAAVLLDYQDVFSLTLSPRFQAGLTFFLGR